MSDLASATRAAVWADTPYELITTTTTHSDEHHTTDYPKDHFCFVGAYLMSQLHNVILRGINAVYNQALGVQKNGTKKDIANFLKYNQLVYEMLHHHHQNEEDYFFPLLAEIAGDEHFNDHEVEEHKQFEDGAEKYKEYIYSVKPEQYDGNKLRQLIDGFGPILHKHLVSEIGMLLRLGKYDSQACKKAFDYSGEKAVKGLSPVRHLPFILGCHDKTFALDGKKTMFPLDVPAISYHIANYVFAWWHAGAWTFAPADIYGTPRPLRFADHPVA